MPLGADVAMIDLRLAVTVIVATQPALESSDPSASMPTMLTLGTLHVPEFTTGTVLALVATSLLVFVSVGVIYLSTVEWRDRRRRGAPGSRS